jgi:ABC-type nitrate/sulfonate/bicarbonate transport system ATPase subunit
MEIKNSNLSRLEFQNVSKYFTDKNNRKIQVLEAISFTLQPGEFIALIGPSGCGKSTILRLAAGLESPSGGSIQHHGQMIKQPDRSRGLVFQSYSIFPWLTVRQNIEFGLQPLHPRLLNEKVDHWLSLTGLTEFANAYPKTLSGGMKQRVALARSLVVEPEILLLDEPLGALDEPTRENMQQLLLKIVENVRCAVILVTHDIREALLLSDRVLLLSQRPGRILDSFTLEQSKPRKRQELNTFPLDKIYDTIIDRFPKQL